ncbi:MAG: C10 family peptidase [Bacteroidaceae bacterium]|nr:C10 family peptidase [Bacteroidaceae bacterium]
MFYLFTLSPLMAAPVGKQAALYTAQSYMLAKGKVVSTAQKPFKARQNTISTAEETEEEAYYYVFNADDGYVIVAADDRVEPILGYVEHGTFDPDSIPENMRSWLDGYAYDIKYVIDNNIQPSSPLLRKRNKINRTRHAVAPLLTSRWSQGLPYQLTLEKYYKGDGSQARPATGCTATAMAQVINFYKYPDKIKTAIPAYSKTYTLDDGTQKTVTFPGVPRNTPIDWENILDSYSCNENHAHTKQDTAVANLMRYCGHSVKMGYGPSSGANFSATPFITYFGYDDDAYRADQKNCTIDEWFDLYYNDIAAGHPVCTAGWTPKGGGHAFVIDGFDGDNLFSVNWGWGGGSAGWMLLTLLNRGDIGEDATAGGYSRSMYGVFNLHLPDNVKAETYLSISDISIASNTSIKATFKNSTGATGSFNVGIVTLDEDGNLALVGAKQSITMMTDGSSQTKTFSLKGQLPEGTYKLSPASKTARGEVWKAAYNMHDKYIEAVVDAEGNMTLSMKTPVPDVSIEAIEFPGTRIVGQEQEVLVTFRNDGDEFWSDVHIFASKTEDKGTSGYYPRVAVRAGETAKYSFFFTPEETGTYNLWFCTKNDGSGEIGRGTMEIITEAEADIANLSISYEVINGANNIAYGNRLYGKANIKNNSSKPYHGGVKLQIWRQAVGGSNAVSGSSKSFDVDIPASRTVSVDFEFDNLSAGNYYRFNAKYSNQSGTLGGGGLWDYKCELQEGLLLWKNDGSVTGKAYSASMTTLSSVCGVLADCSKKITRMRPNRNPNVIYAFTSDMEVPTDLDTCNVVSGKHASRISFVNDQPYYIPVSFTADTASFTYTFPETETGAGWHAFTLPFRADSIFVDGVPVALNDENKPFWIYEFAAQGNNGEVIFEPATMLRGETPYIIAADATMAGRSIVFRSLGVKFNKTGSGKMIVTSPGYRFEGTTLATKVKDCYILNAEGSAFEYVTANKSLTALTSYFTTKLSEEERLPSIVLPIVPLLPDGMEPIQNSRFKIQNDEAIYNLAGQMVNGKLPRGIYIVGGKKVIK